ncbi:MAG: T9SS type A sorting domain-containing protein [Ignavibacteria bacterium]|nr:T9SS type A sorting domain-containing protein [Ignavibacteria bacterium]
MIPSQNGIRIVILKPNVSLKASSSSTYSGMIDSKYAVFSTDKNYPALQKLRLYLAVPSVGELPVSFQVSRTKSLGNKKLAITKDVYASPTHQILINPSKPVKMDVTLRRLGIERGVSVAELDIQPFSYSEDGDLSVMDSAIFDITFSTPLPATNEGLSSLDQSSLSHIANQRQIPALLLQSHSESRKSTSILKQQASDNSWYDPNKTYLRVATTTDGVARLRASDILRSAPEWNGLASSGLHLLYKGNEIPIGFDQEDGKLTIDDEFYFAGQRAKGDSTWLSCLTDEAVYYLYYDNSSVSKRFIPFPEPANTSAEIKSVPISRHIEQDHVYYAGDYGLPAEISVWRTEILYNEGFYWSNLPNNFGAVPFQHQFEIIPSSLATDSLEVAIHYHTIALNEDKFNNPVLEPNYLLSCSLNGLQEQTKSVSGIESGDFRFKLFPTNAVAGISNLMFKSLPVPNNADNELRISSVLVDYLSINGRVKPFAIDGKADWTIDNLPENSRLPIKDLHSEKVIIIDTIQSYLSIKKGTSGTSVRASAVAGQQTSINYSKSSHIVSQPVLLVSISYAPNHLLVDTRGFRDNSNNSAEVRAFIDAAQDGSIITVCLNDTIPLNTATQNYFNELGSKKIVGLASGIPWVACFQKGTGLIAESSGNPASISEFISHPGAIAYQTEISLTARKLYQLQVSGASSAEIASVLREPASNLRDTTTRYDAIIITHPKFLEQANRLAKHRATQGWKVNVVSVTDIYKEFYDGEKSPFALRKFLQFANQNWPKPAPAYLTLMGDASWDPRKNQYGATNEDYVPSYGYPTSDFWYTLLDGNDFLPEMVVGRLPVNTEEEAIAVVDKLIEYDTLPSAPWKKKFMFLSGSSAFEGAFHDVEDFILQPPICGDTIHISGDSKSAVDYTKTTKIRTAINDGVLWLSFNGHSSPDFFELDGWRVEDLNNTGRYNMLTTYSCTSGEFSKPSGVARNESYVVAERKGSVAVFGNTGLGLTDVDAQVSYGMFKTLHFDTTRRVGDILKSAKFGYDHAPEGANMMMQHLLIGDPLTRLALDNRSDLYVLPQEVRITTSLGNSTLSETDSLAVLTFILRNAGVNESQDIPIRIIHRYEGGIDTVRLNVGELCSRIDLLAKLNILNRAGTHTLTFVIDPDSALNESRVNNNTITLTFEVFSAGLASLDPRPYWDVKAINPSFRFVLPQQILKPEFEFRIERDGGSGAPVATLTSSESTSQLTITNLYIEWLPSVELIAGESYSLHARLKNIETGKVSDWLQVPFYAVESLKSSTAQWRQKSSSELLGNSMNNIKAVQRGDSTELHLHNFTLPIVAYSCGNGAGDRHGRTVVGQHEYSATVDQTSFSITHLTPEDTIGTYFDYRTFYNFTGLTAPNLLNCDRAVRYLRDSVADGDIIIITAADACFTGFGFNHPDSAGSQINLIEVLKKHYHSTLIDSVFYGTSYPDGTFFDPQWRHLASWAIIARKGDSTLKAVEAYNSRFDTVEVHDTLQFYTFSGDFSSPTIGPAYDWDSVVVMSNIPVHSTVKTEVYGKFRQSEPEQLLKTTDSSRISLNEISAKEFPYLRLKTQLKRSVYSSEPSIYGLSCNYTPTVEYSLMPGSDVITPEMVLRGDTSIYSVAMTNIAKRGLADTSLLTISAEAEKGAGITYLRTYNLPYIITGDVLQFSDTLASNELASISRIKSIIDAQSTLNELYRFNNSSSVSYHILEDTLKPRVELIVDGISVRDGDYISPKPRFEILVRDNSQLVIDSGKIRVRINRFVQPDTTTREAEFKRIKGNGDLRVNFTFITHRLDEGENFIQIITEDATANKDTLRLYLNVAKFAAISSDLVIPNPTSGQASIQFTYVGIVQDVPASLDIFNMSGQHIRSLTTIAHIGTNDFKWDGYDRFGDQVPPGVYFYRLNVQADNYTDTLFGKIMVTR